MSEIYNFEHIGNVEIRFNSRAKRMKLGVKPDGITYLVIPRNKQITTKNINCFLANNISWINNQKQKYSNVQTIFLPNLDFRTHNHKLNIIISNKCIKAQASILKDEILIVFPSTADIMSAHSQKFIRMVIDATLREEAQLYLPPLVFKFAEQHGFKYNRISIKNAKTRWGSCSARKNINLNLHLMRLPQYLINYVILHELAHTVELNHSQRFWNLLEKICPNSLTLDTELNKYNTEIY